MSDAKCANNIGRQVLLRPALAISPLHKFVSSKRIGSSLECVVCNSNSEQKIRDSNKFSSHYKRLSMAPTTCTVIQGCRVILRKVAITDSDSVDIMFGLICSE
eukprot:scaffold230800_cov40-Prasinocladus_malaysianus.AAC.1